MSRWRSVRAVARADAPVDVVWSLLADGERWASFMPLMRHSSYERGGAPARGGVGAIRAFGTGKAVSREEVVAFDPPTHLGYVALSGLPMTGYRADVTLAPTPDGCATTITWASTWRSSPLGPALWAFLSLVLRSYARALAREAARVGAARSSTSHVPPGFSGR